VPGHRNPGIGNELTGKRDKKARQNAWQKCPVRVALPKKSHHY